MVRDKYTAQNKHGFGCTFTEDILNEKLHFWWSQKCALKQTWLDYSSIVKSWLHLNETAIFYFLWLSRISLARPKKCQYLDIFWSAFSHIWTEYRDLLCKSSDSVQVQENRDEKNSKYRHFCVVLFRWKSSIIFSM